MIFRPLIPLQDTQRCKEPYRVLTVCLRSSDLGTPGLRRMTLGVCYYGLTPDLGVELVGRL